MGDRKIDLSADNVFVVEYTHFVSVAGLVCNDKDESLRVKWVKKDEALELVTFPLTRKRLENMLAADDKVSCFNFIREPFEVVTEGKYTVGE